MKNRQLLFVLILLLICPITFGQKTNVPSKDTTNSMEVTILALQDSIQQLLLTNQSQQKQIDELNQKVKDSISDFNSKMSCWLTFFAIALALFSIIIPYFMNSNSKELMSQMLVDAKKEANEARKQATSTQLQVGDAKQQASTATEQAKKAEKALNGIQSKIKVATKQALLAQAEANKAANVVNTIEIIKSQIDSIQKQINDTSQKVDKKASETIQAADETKAISLFNDGIDKYKQRLFEEAKGYFNKAISLNDKYSEAFYYLGLTKYDDEPIEAMNDIAKAIAINSDFADALYIKSLLEFEMGETKSAISDIDNAKKLKKDVIELYSNRQFLRGKMKDFDNSINEVTYSTDMKELRRVPPGKKAPFIILDCVTKIGEAAFMDYKQLTSITIPYNVEIIEDNAFDGCDNLREIHLKLKNLNPDIFTNDTFSGLNISKVTIYVPINKVNAFKRHPLFSQFANILPEN